MTLFASVLLALVGNLLKILHLGGATTYWIVVTAIIIHIAFVIISLLEILSSNKIVSSEKIAWTIGFIFLSIITSLFYWFMGRKRVLGLYRDL